MMSGQIPLKPLDADLTIFRGGSRWRGKAKGWGKIELKAILR
jgi:hypothetical protein